LKDQQKNGMLFSAKKELFFPFSSLPSTDICSTEKKRSIKGAEKGTFFYKR